jgi:hypothetical protein
MRSHAIQIRRTVGNFSSSNASGKKGSEGNGVEIKITAEKKKILMFILFSISSQIDLASSMIDQNFPMKCTHALALCILFLTFLNAF